MIVVFLSRPADRFRAATVEQRYRQVQSDIDKVLTLLGNIADRLDDGQDKLQRRIERLERHVGLATRYSSGSLLP